MNKRMHHDINSGARTVNITVNSYMVIYRVFLWRRSIYTRLLYCVYKCVCISVCVYCVQYYKHKTSIPNM